MRVSPGVADTGAWNGLGEQAKAQYFKDTAVKNPARRIGTAEDVAGAVLFALTSTFLTGVTLRIDGGQPLTSMARPPPGRGCAVMVAAWAVAMARTMERPRPCPLSRRAGRGPSRWKGWNRRSTSAAWMTCPELVTDKTAPACLAVVVIWMSPPAMLCRTALSIRLAASCWTRRGSPSRMAGWMLAWTCRPRRLIAGRAAARTALVMAAQVGGLVLASAGLRCWRG